MMFLTSSWECSITSVVSCHCLKMPPHILPCPCMKVIPGERKKNLNGSSYNNIIFHSPLQKALDVLARECFNPEQLSPTLPFLILTLTLASSSLSFGAANASALTFMPKTLPRNERSIALTVPAQKNMRKPVLFFSRAHPTPSSTSVASVCFHFLIQEPPMHHSFTLIRYTNTHLGEIAFLLTAAYFLQTPQGFLTGFQFVCVCL